MGQANKVRNVLKKNSGISTSLTLTAFLLLIASGLGLYFQIASIGIDRRVIPVPPESAATTDAGYLAMDPPLEPVILDKRTICRTTLDSAAELIAELAQKKSEINQLLGYYQAEINEHQKQIIQESRKNKIFQYARAIKNNTVELNLRNIQRRRLYIRKLEDSNTRIQKGSEELLYLKRRTQLDLQLIDLAGGIDLGRHMQQLKAAIQKYRPASENLAINLHEAEEFSLETIWLGLVGPKEKIEPAPLIIVDRATLESLGQEKLNQGDLRAFHKRISARLPRYRRFIQAAAEKHGFDWQLIVAQIYQESHIDPLAKSFAGARGLMQILPGTARSLGVKDVYNAVENINGGVRYLKELYDYYHGIAGIDRMMMALAAYNAGRGHVEDARRLAVKKKLDPDSWESLTKTLPLLRYRKYYEQSKYGYCRGTEPVIYTKRIMAFYNILKRREFDMASAQAKLK